jgi:hypothetical protein
MPILALFRWQADPDVLIDAYDRELEDAPSVTLEQPRRTLHVFAPGEDGAVVVDLWESEEDFRRMFNDPDFRETSKPPAGRASQTSRFSRFTPRCLDARTRHSSSVAAAESDSTKETPPVRLRAVELTTTARAR